MLSKMYKKTIDSFTQKRFVHANIVSLFFRFLLYTKPKLIKSNKVSVYLINVKCFISGAWHIF